MYNFPALFCGLLFIVHHSSALEYGRQRLNTNTDFLLHEGGSEANGGKRDYVAPQSSGGLQSSQNGGHRDYLAEFPPLGTTPKPLSTLSSSTTSFNNINQQTSSAPGGKRDYVSPQRPSTPVTQRPSTKPPSPTTAQHQHTPQPGGKRDYVAPQFPPLKPVQQNNQPAGGQPSPTQPPGSKVKDLISFFDKNPNQGTTVQGNKNLPTPKPTSSYTQFTLSGTTWRYTTSSPTIKPPSFSSIVAGGGKHNTQSTTVTTAKPTTRMPSSPAAQPSTPVLPSSIVNNNRGTGNANTVSDAELQTLSEELLRKDSNNAAKYITINYQEKTTSYSTEDKAPQPLLTLSPEVWNIPTIQTLVPLLDNYERDTLVNEYVTPQERNEENAFMDAIMSTAVIRHLMTFLRNKGYVTPDAKQQRDFLKQMWFNLYSRGKGKISSSGFEHVFLSELKNGQVSGFHNWIYFSKEESRNRLNYLGYLKYLPLNDKGTVLKYHFNQQGVDKPVNSMFIGTSPELEVALYTLCFVTRVDNDCKLKLANKDVDIVTHNFRYRSKNYIGSAYPQI